MDDHVSKQHLIRTGLRCPGIGDIAISDTPSSLHTSIVKTQYRTWCENIVDLYEVSCNGSYC